jgi:hypothetical protein
MRASRLPKIELRMRHQPLLSLLRGRVEHADAGRSGGLNDVDDYVTRLARLVEADQHRTGVTGYIPPTNAVIGRPRRRHTSERPA